MTYPIKKRISTELFIDRKMGLYIQKWLLKCFGKITEGKIYWRETEMWE